jgi:DNA primase large subunit
MKYDFFEMRDCARKGKALPTDINQFVVDEMKKYGFADVIPRIYNKQNHFHFGEITVMDSKNLARRIEIVFRYGMVQYFDMIEETFLSPNGLMIVDKARIKNPAINSNENNRKDK